jgi:hypothetical protein
MPQAQQPAGVSGPGALSKRTDGGPAQALRDLPDAKYGENSQFQALQQGASLSASPGPQGQAQPMPPGGPQGLPPNPAAGQVTPMSAPTARPDEPVTSGAAMGPGPGPSALGGQPAQVASQDMGKISQSLPLFEMMANMYDAEPSTRLFVNLLKGAP